MKLFFDGRESKKLNVRRDTGRIKIIEYYCGACGHGKAWDHGTHKKCSRCGWKTWS